MIIMRNIKYDNENKKIHFYVIYNRISKNSENFLLQSLLKYATGSQFKSLTSTSTFLVGRKASLLNLD